MILLYIDIDIKENNHTHQKNMFPSLADGKSIVREPRVSPEVHFFEGPGHCKVKL